VSSVLKMFERAGFLQENDTRLLLLKLIERFNDSDEDFSHLKIKCKRLELKQKKTTKKNEALKKKL